MPCHRCRMFSLPCLSAQSVSAPRNPSLPSTWTVWSRASTVASLSHLQSISSLTDERSAHQEATGRTGDRSLGIICGKHIRLRTVTQTTVLGRIPHGFLCKHGNG